MNTLAEYAMVSRTYETRLDTLSREGLIQREASYFRENISKVSTGEELIEDYRLYRFAMKAFGLESETYAKGLMRKVFEEGVTDKRAMANRLQDGAYREIAEAFGFAETGNLNMLLNKNVDAVVDKYLQRELEERVGENNQGVRLALYFERKIGNVDNWYEVIGDSALYEVVRTMMGVPQEFVNTDIDRQADYFENRMPLDDLKDPQKRGKWMQRFTAMWDMQQGPQANSVDLAANGIAAIQPLSNSGPSITTIDPALLADLSKYRI